MALTKTRSRGINLADTFAFTGTVSGAGVSGKVLQIIQDTDNTEFSTASTSFVRCTNLTASITPIQANSTFIIMLHGVCRTAQYTRYLNLDIMRSINGGTYSTLSGQAGGFLSKYDAGTTKEQVQQNITYEDSPTYTLGNTIDYSPALKFGGGNTPPAYFGLANVLSTIQVWEIAE